MKIVFRITTEKTTEKDDGVNGDVTSLKGVLKDIYLVVLNNPGIKIAQVAELRGKSESTVWKQLNELTKKGIIEYRGSDKTGGYYVT